MSGIVLPCGLPINFLVFDLRNLSIEDLALNLSHVRRFCGVGLSDAQHSVLVMERVGELIAEDPGFWGGHNLDPVQAKRCGLMHDTPEGLGLGDVVGPLKHLDELAGYRKIERRAWLAAADRFALPRVIPAVVRRADAELGKTEQHWLGLAHPEIDWPGVSVLDLDLERWTPERATAAFLIAAEELGIR